MNFNPDNFKPLHIMVTIGAFFFAGLMFISQGNAKVEYQPLTPQAEKSFIAAQKVLCEAEKTLAQSKLQDFINNALTLTPEDAKRLAEKREKKCDF